MALDIDAAQLRMEQLFEKFPDLEKQFLAGDEAFCSRVEDYCYDDTKSIDDFNMADIYDFGMDTAWNNLISGVDVPDSEPQNAGITWSDSSEDFADDNSEQEEPVEEIFYSVDHAVTDLQIKEAVLRTSETLWEAVLNDALSALIRADIDIPAPLTGYYTALDNYFRGLVAALDEDLTGLVRNLFDLQAVISLDDRAFKTTQQHFYLTKLGTTCTDVKEECLDEPEEFFDLFAADEDESGLDLMGNQVGEETVAPVKISMPYLDDSPAPNLGDQGFSLSAYICSPGGKKADEIGMEDLADELESLEDDIDDDEDIEIEPLSSDDAFDIDFDDPIGLEEFESDPETEEELEVEDSDEVEVAGGDDSLLDEALNNYNVDDFSDEDIYFDEDDIGDDISVDDVYRVVREQSDSEDTFEELEDEPLDDEDTFEELEDEPLDDEDAILGITDEPDADFEELEYEPMEDEEGFDEYEEFEYESEDEPEDESVGEDEPEDESVGEDELEDEFEELEYESEDAGELESDDFEELEDEPEDTSSGWSVVDSIPTDDDFDECEEEIDEEPVSGDPDSLFDLLDDDDDFFNEEGTDEEGFEELDAMLSEEERQQAREAADINSAYNPLSSEDRGIPTSACINQPRTTSEKNEATAELILSLYAKLSNAPSITKKVFRNIFSKE